MRFDSQQDDNKESKKINAAADKLKEAWKTDDGKKKILLFTAINLISIYVIGYYIVLTSKVGLFQKKDYSVLSCILHTLSLKGLFFLLVVNAIVFVGYTIYKRRDLEHRKKNKVDFDISEKTTYGDAKPLNGTEDEEKVLSRVKNTEEEINKEKGLIMGVDDVTKEVITKEYRGNENRNIALCGGPGSGKSRAHIRNMIFQCVANRFSMFITDPKGELAESMSTYLEKNEYTVRFYNLKDFASSDGFNCLDGMDNEKGLAGVNDLVDIIMKNTKSEAGNGGSPSAVKSFITAMIKYVLCEMPEGHKNMVEVLYLATLCDLKTLDEMFEKLDIFHPAKVPYYATKGGSDNFRANIRTDALTRLCAYSEPGIRNMSIDNDIDLTLPGKKPCAYFIISPDDNGAYDFMVNLFQAVAYKKLMNFADEQPGCVLPNLVYMLYDEFSNIGIIPDFTRKISTARSRGIATVIAYQSLPQLKNRYPDAQWEEILGACDTSIFAGCNDETTAEYFSKKTGVATTKVETTQTSANGSIIPGTNTSTGDRVSIGEGKRYLYTEDRLLKMKYPEQLIFNKGYDVFYCHKFDYSNHPQSKYLIYRKASNHVPKWRMKDQPYNLEALNLVSDLKMMRQNRKNVVNNNQETPPIPDDIPQNNQSLNSQHDTQENNWGTGMFNQDNVTG